MKPPTCPGRRGALITGSASFAALAAFGGWPGAPARAVEARELAPDFSLPGAPGAPGAIGAGAVQLRALRGKVVLLDFWASWCAPCKLSFPWMSQMQARHGANGLQVVAINLDRDARLAEAFLRAVLPLMSAPLVIAYDSAGETPRRYAVRAMPTSLLIGADGTVLLKHAGFKDEDRAGLEAAIAAALERLPR